MSAFKVYYFNFRCRAEPIRWILKYANEEFDDIRFELKDWPAIKSSMPFGKTPVLEMNGKKYSNSLAILGYLGQKFNIAGSDDLETLTLNGIGAMLYDLIGYVENVTYYFKKQLGENLPKELDKMIDEALPQQYFTYLEEIVAKNDGFFSKGKLSWVDIYFAATVEYIKGLLVYVKKEDKIDFLTKFPNLTKLSEKVVAIESIKKWICERPEESDYAHCFD